MKSKRLLLMLLLAVFGVARAQVTIGDLETAGNDTYLPMNSLYEYSYSQQIYTADEIGTAGTINAITVWMYGAADLYTIPFDIYMVETDKESFTGTDWESVSSSDIVYSGSVTVHNTTAEAYTFELDAPFAYSGQGNLMIAFDNNCGQWKGGLNGKVFTATDNVSRSMYVRRDSNDYDPTNMSGISGTARAMRNVIEIDITPGGGPTCARPTNFVVSYTGGSTATVTWEGEASLYNIDINGTVTEGVTSPYVMNVLPATTYTVKVQADCGDGLTSGWTGAQSFFTPCEAFDLPYAYGFEDANELNCWNMVYTANTPGIYNGLAYEGNNSFRFSSYSSASSYDQYLISPQLNTTNGVDVTFYYAGYSYGSETFKVGYSTTSNDPSAFTWGDQITATGTDWNLYEGSFPAGTKFVGIYYFSNYQYYMYVDDFNFEVPSSCRKPTNLAASEIGPRTATLSWTENGEARSWNLLVNGELIEGVDNPHTLTGLTPETAYTVQVSPVCEVEKWSDAITFTTLELCPKPTNVAVSDITPMSANVSWTGTASSYNLRYRIARGFHYDFETATPWVEDNFAPCTTYDGDGLHTYQITDWTPLGEYQFYGSMMTLQSGVTDFASAHGGELFGGFVAGIPADDVEHNDDYFILPSITIEDGYVFEFWASSLLDNWGLEHMRVGVYGGNGTITDYLAGSATEYVEVPVGWTKYSYDLSAFAGQTIQLAINSLCPDAYILGIDDIFVGDPNEDTWDVTLNDVTSPYAMTGLTEETMYEVQVQAACGEDGESAWVSATFTTLSNCEAPTALNVTNLMPTTATLNWTGYQDGFEARYRIPASEEILFFEDFEGLEESALPEGWTSIDSDGDGNGWYSINQESFAPYCHSGQGLVTSASYSGSALTPDNWLVTPQIALQGTMRVWLRAQDPSYAAEHYAIYLSTTGNEVADFTTTLVEEAYDLTGEYIQISADLSAYNGQMGYIAIRHFNCSDEFRLNVDDFGIYGGEVPAGEWIVVTSDATSVDIEELDPETTYEWQVRGENRNCTNGEDEGYTAWSELGTFTTPGLCDNPNTFVFENLEATTATLTWTGYQESFNVMYRTAETYDELFYDDLEEGIDEWTTPNDDNLFTLSFTDGSSMTCYGFVGDGTTQTLISPEFESAPAGYALRFFYYAYQASIQTFNVGFSTDGENFTYTGEVTTDEENYVDYYEVNVPEGAKYFAIQSSGASNYLLLGEFWIYANYVAPGEWVELTVNEPSVTMEPLVPETLYEVYVQGICGEEEYTEAVGGYFTTPELTTVTQTIALAAGVNWVSFYVETTLDDLKAALQATGGTNIVIQAKVGSTTWNGRRWLGTVSGFSVTQMYKIQVPADCEIAIEGMPLNPAELPITISNGANWIGFPFSESMSLADAFAGFSANQDAVSSKNGSSTWNGRRWLGSLSTLVPGQGYIYNSKATEDKTFVYPTDSSKAAQDVTISLTTGHKSMKNSTISVLSIKKTSANTTSVDRSFAKDRKNEKKSYAKENAKSIYMFKK